MEKQIIVYQGVIILLMIGYWFFNKSVERYKKRKVKKEIEEALITDGGHHKQWYLHRIARELNIDVAEFEEGIAP